MTSPTSSSVASKANTSSSAPKGGPPTWIRLGVPAAFAVLAMILNFAAIKKQIQPVRAYAIKQNLPMGSRLQASHLQLIDLAGNFDRSAVVLEHDLLLRDGDGEGTLSLQASLARNPRILTRNAKAGEILIKSSVGGTQAPAANEGSVEVDRSVLNVSDDLLVPGRLIHFMISPADRDETEQGTKFIGPFRVAWKDEGFASDEPKRGKRSTVRIVFATRNQQPTADSQMFLRAVAEPDKFKMHGQLFGAAQPAANTQDLAASHSTDIASN